MPPWDTSRPGILPSNLTAHDADAARLQQTNRLGVGFTFSSKDAVGKLLGGIIFFHRDHLLQQNGAMIVLIIDKMDRAATNFCAVGNDCLMDMPTIKAFSTERGDQSRVDVEYAVREVLGNEDML